ncbi:hypothetical protein ACFL08_03065 [Patescibacteria group bacterium]
MAFPVVIRILGLVVSHAVTYYMGRSNERSEGKVNLAMVLNEFGVPIAEAEAVMKAYAEKDPESFIDEAKEILRPYPREMAGLRDAIGKEIGQMAGMEGREATSRALFTLGRKAMEKKGIKPVDQGFDENEFDGFYGILDENEETGSESGADPEE